MSLLSRLAVVPKFLPVYAIEKMNEDRSDLMVFIDLGFVLLVGFLLLTETTPRNNVALPGDVEQAQSQPLELAVHNLHFSGNQRFWIEDGVQTFCDLVSIQSLEACMSQIVQSRTGVVFVLIPTLQASVQELVELLDLCEFKKWTCTVNN